MTEIATAEKPAKPSYGEAEIQRGLIAVAACSGNASMAARALAEDGLEIDQATLWRWSRKQHVDKYERVRAEVIPRITAQAAEQHMDLALRQTEVAGKALERIEARLPSMEDKDLINALGKADIGSGIHTEKAQLLSGQPTHRESRSVEELIRGLASKGLKLGEEREEADGSRVKRVAVLGSEESGSEDVAEGSAVPPEQDTASLKRA